jgi:hypothetical protein
VITWIRNFLLNQKGRPKAQLGKRPNEMPSEDQADLDLPFLVRKLWMRYFLLNRKGRPIAQLGKRPNEMPSENQVDLDLPFQVRKLWMRNFLLNRKGRLRAQIGKSPNEIPSEDQVDRDLSLWIWLERFTLVKNQIGVSREPLELVDLLPPLLAPTILLIVRVAKNAAMLKLQDLVHRDQKGMKRQQLEDKSKANLPFLELTLLPHRMQDISKLVSLHPQDTVLSTKKERKRISQLNLWQ